MTSGLDSVSRSAAIAPVSAPSGAELSALRRMMLHCVRNFPTYDAIIRGSGVTEMDIELGDPLEILSKLPIIGGDELIDISMDAVGAIDSIVDTETSSGTTGRGKIRFISYEDDAEEHKFLARLLSVCGIGGDDKVACVDTDPAAVMISFPRACELIPTAESYCVSAGPDFDRLASLLGRLKPTAIVSVPSIIERALDAAEEAGRRMPDTVRKMVCIGEGVNSALRKRVEVAFGAETFSYYGSSETSALGIECAGHSGIHLFGSRTLFELDREPSCPERGELILSTLVQRGLPLLRYRLGDVARLRSDSCGCGLETPRVDVIGRSEMFASILGSKIHHHSIHESMARAGLSGPLQIFLEDDRRRQTMRLRVADRNSGLEERLLSAAISDNQDIEFLLDSGFLDVKIEFRAASELLRDRKPNKLVDLRS